MDMLKSLIASAAAGIVALGFAAAAPIVGGTVSYDANAGTVTGSGIVGPGEELNSFAAFWDVDSGVDRDILTYRADGTFGGIWVTSGTSTMTFDLPLAGGDAIVGATVLSSAFANTMVSWAGNLLTVTWDEGTHSGLSWEIDIDYAADSAVPVPAAALLFAPAAFLAARRRKANAA